MKSLFNKQTEQNAERADETEKANETAGDGGEEHGEQTRKKQKIYNKKNISGAKKY